MRISDWSSDVCSSDLLCRQHLPHPSHSASHSVRSSVFRGRSQKGSFISPSVQVLPQPLPAILRPHLCLAGRSTGLPEAFHQDPSNRVSGYDRSEEHTSELQSLMRRSYAVICLIKIKHTNTCSADRDYA